MGRIFATYDIMPESDEVSMDKVAAALKGIIPKGVELNNTKVEPIAFGLKKVVASFVIDDSVDGVGSALESGIASIPGVENVECTSSALL